MKRHKTHLERGVKMTNTVTGEAREFVSIAELVRETGLNVHIVSSCLNNDKPYKEFIFEPALNEHPKNTQVELKLSKPLYDQINRVSGRPMLTKFVDTVCRDFVFMLKQYEESNNNID